MSAAARVGIGVPSGAAHPTSRSRAGFPGESELNGPDVAAVASEVETIELVGPTSGSRWHGWLGLATCLLVIGVAVGIARPSGREGSPGNEPPAGGAPISDRPTNPQDGVGGPPPASSLGRSIVILVPAGGDFLWSDRVAVAGVAYDRPHGASIRAVNVQLFVNGVLADTVELDVVSGRFVGFAKVPAPGHTLAQPPITDRAQLRITDAARPDQAPATVEFTIDRR